MEARNMMKKLNENGGISDLYINEAVSRWKKVPGLLESDGENDPIKNRRIMGNMAVLYDNQREYLTSLNEDTTTGNVAYYTKRTFPVLRRVWPNLIANQIVSVQPMATPISGVLYYEKVYTDTKGAKLPYNGISNNPTDMAYQGKLGGGDYMQQNFGRNYSSEFVDYDDTCTDTGTGTATLTQASTNCAVPKWGPIRDNGTIGQRTFFVKAHYRMLDADAASAPVEVVATMDASGNLIDNTANTNTVGTFNISTGAWSITPAGSAGTASNFANNTVVYFQYFVEFEQVANTAGARIPSVDIKMSLMPIQAESSKLKASWSVEAAEDMKMQNGIDIEAEIVETFSNEVIQEIDARIIDELITGAMHSATYTYTATVPGELESIRKALTQIGAISASIQKTTKRAGANFIVAGPEFCALLDQLSTHGDYASIESSVKPANYGPMMSDFGIARVGTLLKKWVVYVNPHQDSSKVLIGLRGNSFWDAGYVYAPYIPLSLTPTFLDPNTQANSKGVWTRYATKMLRNEYYGVLTVSGLPSVTVTP